MPTLCANCKDPIDGHSETKALNCLKFISIDIQAIKAVITDGVFHNLKAYDG